MLWYDSGLEALLLLTLLAHLALCRWVPLGQLVPPVTNRANYIHWLQDLLGLSAPKGELLRCAPHLVGHQLMHALAATPAGPLSPQG